MLVDRVQVLRSRLLVDAVELHLRGFFRGHEGIRHSGRVLVVPPGPSTSLWTYVTAGAHATPRSRGSLAHELLLLAPAADEAHVELVARAAQKAPAPGRFASAGRSWLPGSACTQLYCRAACPFGPALEHCEDAHGPVQILWLVPVSAEERGFAERHGAEALEQRLDEAGVDVARADRALVV